MSIELIGPAKYEFQYLVSAYLSLPFLNNEENEIVIEQQFGEDLQLNIRTDTDTRIIEVQVKGSDQDADLNFVCNCLAHFPSNSANDCLLERVLNRPDGMALIVASGRCKDEVRAFALSDDWRGEIHHDPPIGRNATGRFREEFRNQWSSDSELYKARREKCEKLSSIGLKGT